MEDERRFTTRCVFEKTSGGSCHLRDLGSSLTPRSINTQLIALSTKLTTPTTTTTTTTLPPPFTTQPHILPSAPSFSLAPIALPDLHPRPTLDHSDFETPMRQPASTYIDRNRGFDDDEEELSAGEEANLRMRGKRGERKSPEGVQRPGVSGNQRY